MKRKILVCFLVLTLILPTLFSCNTNNGNEEETKKVETETTFEKIEDIDYESKADEYLSKISDSDLAGLNIVIANNGTDVVIPDNTSSLENAARYAAIQKVENKLNCKLSNVVYVGADQLLSNLQVEEASGDSYCDIALTQYNSIGGHIYHSTLLDLNAVGGLDTGADYVSQSSVEAMTVGEVTYAIYSSFTKDVRDDYAIFYQKNENGDILYTEAKNGTLTWDKVFQYIKNTSDSNNKTTIVTYDGYSELGDIIYQSSGNHYLSKDENNGLVNISQLESNNVLVSYIGIVYDYYLVSSADNGLKQFSYGNAPLLIGSLDTMKSITDISSDWGILPIPKYAEDQDNYYSPANGSTCLITVPNTSNNLDKVGMVINALNASHYGVIADAVNEEYIRYNIRDNGTILMFSLIEDNLTFDFAFAVGNAYSGIAKGTYRLVRYCAQNKQYVNVQYPSRIKNVQYDIDRLSNAYWTNN